MEMCEVEEDDFFDDFPEEHGHFCPKCGVIFLCYEDCPDDTPNKRCVECEYRRVR